MSRALLLIKSQVDSWRTRFDTVACRARVFAALFLLTSLAWVMGCSGVSSAPVQDPSSAATPTPRPSPTPPPTPSASLFLYLGTRTFWDSPLDAFQGFQIDPHSGALTLIPGSPFQMPSNMYGIFPVAQSSYLFFQTFGFCTPPPGSPDTCPPFGFYSVRIQPDGSPDTSTLNLLGPDLTAVGANPSFYDVSAPGLNTYRANGVTGSISLVHRQHIQLSGPIITGWANRLWLGTNSRSLFSYTVDPVSGDVQPEQEIVAGRSPSAFDAQGYAFDNGILAETDDGTGVNLDVFVLQNGSFVQVQHCANSMLPVCPPNGIVPAIHPNGHIAFVPIWEGSQLMLWSIPLDPSVGLRVADAKKYAVKAFYLTFSPDGRYLYTTDGNEVDGFTVDNAGNLTPVPGSPYKVPVRHDDVPAFAVVEIVKH
jgi:hypothetical protein